MLYSLKAAQAVYLFRHPRGVAIHGWAVCAAGLQGVSGQCNGLVLRPSPLG
jgi:hypothetical protein